MWCSLLFSPSAQLWADDPQIPPASASCLSSSHSDSHWHHSLDFREAAVCGRLARTLIRLFYWFLIESVVVIEVPRHERSWDALDPEISLIWFVASFHSPADLCQSMSLNNPVLVDDELIQCDTAQSSYTRSFFPCGWKQVHSACMCDVMGALSVSALCSILNRHFNVNCCTHTSPVFVCVWLQPTFYVCMLVQAPRIHTHTHAWWWPWQQEYHQQKESAQCK